MAKRIIALLCLFGNLASSEAQDVNPVQFADLPSSAEFTVYLSDLPSSAHRRICIVNPDTAPNEFWKALPKWPSPFR